MRLVELPRYAPLAVYEKQIDRMVSLLKRNPNVVSIYQVGSVGTPGISDADLWVIFSDGTNCDFDHRMGLDSDGRYIFTHGLFGICQSHFLKSQKFRFFHDFRLLFGDDLQSAVADESDLGDCEILVERQAALEYMINAFQVFTVEQTFGVASVRNLLLYAKALLMDIEPLGVESGSSDLRETLQLIMNIRESWFERTFDVREISQLHDECRNALRCCLSDYFRDNTLWYPHSDQIVLRGNMRMVNSPEFKEKISGIRLPSWLIVRHKRIRNLQRRFLRFEFLLPIDGDAPCPGVEERFELIGQAQKYNRIHLPNFMPLPVGLSIVDATESERR